MEREILVQKTIGRIKQLPIAQIQEVNDFVEFVIHKTEEALIMEGLQQLSASGSTYDFLNDEPELYTVNDLKVVCMKKGSNVV